MNVSIKSTSANLITDFFQHSINSILYQRGIYPSEDFKLVKKYNLQLLMITDPDIKLYLNKILLQLNKWLKKNSISKLMVDIINKETVEVVERWQFDIELLNNNTFNDNSGNGKGNGKGNGNGVSDDEIQKQIQQIIRQITASITFLPILETGDYTFNVLVSYNDTTGSKSSSEAVPNEWIDFAKLDQDFNELVQFKDLKTGEHKVSSVVSYKLK